MPELPEVETTVKSLNILKNKKVINLDIHTKNFVDCIKNNDPKSLNCGIESGSIVASNAHMGNVAYRTGNKIYWNKDRENFGSNYKANSYIRPKYNNGWSLPRI